MAFVRKYQYVKRSACKINQIEICNRSTKVARVEVPSLLPGVAFLGYVQLIKHLWTKAGLKTEIRWQKIDRDHKSHMRLHPILLELRKHNKHCMGTCVHAVCGLISPPTLYYLTLHISLICRACFMCYCTTYFISILFFLFCNICFLP